MARQPLVPAKVMRRIGRIFQRDMVRRLRQGTTARGGKVARKDQDTIDQDGNRPGVVTGKMLAALSSPGALIVTRKGFRIEPKGREAQKWSVYNRGNRRQPARPVAGASKQAMKLAQREVARAGRDEIVKRGNRRLRATRGR